MREIADVLNQMGEIALEHDILACYHNHTETVGETLEETEALVSMTDPAKFFGFLDAGHATKDFAGHPVAKRVAMFLARNWDRIRFIEFKDWSPEHDRNVVLGQGETDWDAVFGIIKKRGYSGWITIVSFEGPPSRRRRGGTSMSPGFREWGDVLLEEVEQGQAGDPGDGCEGHPV